MTVETSQVDPRCALPVLSFTVGDREVPEHHDDIRALYLPLFGIIAIEMLERKAGALYGGHHIMDDEHAGKVMRLDIKLMGPATFSWQVWLQHLDCGTHTHQIVWPIGAGGKRGPVFDTITAWIEAAQKQMAERHPYLERAHIEIRTDFSSVSAHQKLQMMKARAEALSLSGADAGSLPAGL
jgi:hypothetical protein